jgi:hypothetical protein
MRSGTLTSKAVQFGRRLHVNLRLLLRRLKKCGRRFWTASMRRKALLWQRFYAFRYQYLVWQTRHDAVTAAIALLMFVGGTAFWIRWLQKLLAPLFKTETSLASLRSLFVTLGGALVGAVAIVSSLVLFAMQVNIERMPHGLFRRLSTDPRLLGGFAATFLVAVAVAALSLVLNQHRIGIAVFCAFWGIVFILAMFHYCYRRALTLVNPLQQLELVIRRTRGELRAWVRRASRARPLLSGGDSPTPHRADRNAPQYDLARMAFFQANPRWTSGAMQEVRYAVSLARRYAEQGDHEVSAVAMSAIVEINRAYVEAKGRTFFAHELMLDNPLTSDEFINDTLEHLRQDARIGVARADEQQVEQTLRAMVQLVEVYLRIDYPRRHASKTHAHLAAGYLSDEVKRIVLHNMPDVLMEGVRLMGQCAAMLLEAEGPNGIMTLTQEIRVVSCAGVAREDYRPVISTGVEQLARLSFDLLRTQLLEVKFAAREIRASMELIAKLLMTLPEPPFTTFHSTYLAPYYSATSMQALSVRLSELVDAIGNAPEGDANAQRVIDNMEEWADGMYQTEKELLLLAVAKHSHFTFDMIHWIKNVTAMLLAVSNAAACDRHTQGKLRRHARWLISVLSFVPSDEETVKFVENFQMTETLFESALDARRRGCPEIAETVRKLLVSRMFNGGQYQAGWPILERSVYGLAILALLDDEPGTVARLKQEISARLEAGELPDKDRRNRAAREIRGCAATLFRARYWPSGIERHMAKLDPEKLQPLLEEIADLISPETKGEADEEAFL